MGGIVLRRRLRFASVLVVVVLALTGFSTVAASKGKSRGSSSSSGGGCSSSSKDNDSSSHGSGYRDTDYDDDTYDDTYGSSGGSEATPAADPTSTEEAEVEIVDCAGPANKRKRGGKPDTTATVRITSLVSYDETFDVALSLQGTGGSVVDQPEKKVMVRAGETRTVEVRMAQPRQAKKVRTCAVDSVYTV